MENLSVISLICGLPGSGKTRLVNILRQRSVVNEEKSESHLNGINIYVVSYDELIPIVGQKEMAAAPGIWKEARKDVICATDALICHVIGLPFSSQLSDTAKILLEKLIQLNKQKVNCSQNAFLIDDNFYYKSMRYEWYLLAKKLSMGFCQIYLECLPEIASCRNQARKVTIPDDVIQTMAKRFEVPNQYKNPWEKNSLCINVGNVQESFINKVLIIIEESLKKPLTPNIEENIEKEQAKRICSTNIIHQIDIILRHLTGEKIKKIQALHGNKIIKKYSTLLNDARRNILKALKQGELILSKDLLAAIESGNCNNDELQKTLSAILESICTENITF